MPIQGGAHLVSRIYTSSYHMYGSLSRHGDPNIDPKILYNPYYGDPQRGTPNF